MSNPTEQTKRGPIDSRRRLTPRDYADRPHAFGEHPSVEFRTPPGGDDVSCQIAKFIHEMVLACRHHSTSLNGAAVARRFAFSRQTWSSITRGHRWPGHTFLVALLVTLRDNRPQPTVSERQPRRS